MELNIEKILVKCEELDIKLESDIEERKFSIRELLEQFAQEFVGHPTIENS